MNATAMMSSSKKGIGKEKQFILISWQKSKDRQQKTGSPITAYGSRQIDD
jgi:hypothetical protein